MPRSLSGDVPQHKRIKTLEGFREGKIRFLVATDVAAVGFISTASAT